MGGSKIKDNPNKCIFMTDFQSSGKADEMFQITLYFGLYSTIVKRTMVNSEKKTEITEHDTSSRVFKSQLIIPCSGSLLFYQKVQKEFGAGRGWGKGRGTGTKTKIVTVTTNIFVNL